MVVCSIRVVGWSVSGVCMGCKVSCGVHGVYFVCIVWYKCGMCAVNLGCLCVLYMCVMSVMCGCMCGMSCGICAVCMKYVWSFCVWHLFFIHVVYVSCI